MADDLLIRRDGPVATLVLNRPDKRNAMTVAMWSALPSLLAPLAQHPQVRLLVVRGAGGAFASGADIAEMPEVYASAEAASANDARIQAAMTALETFPRPTLAAIQGPCVGGGCGLALACDLRFAEAGARIGITPARLGLVYGIEDCRRLVQAVGLSAAKDMLFTGRLLDAREALDVGLVDRVVEPGALDAAVSAWAADVVASSPWTQQSQKAILSALGRPDAAALSAELFARSFIGPDFKEGFEAFTRKRPPRF